MREGHYAGICHAELSEASRSLERKVLHAITEILRHEVPQNDIGQKHVILRSRAEAIEKSLKRN